MGYGMRHHLKILLELRARFGKKGKTINRIYQIHLNHISSYL